MTGVGSIWIGGSFVGAATSITGAGLTVIVVFAATSVVGPGAVVVVVLVAVAGAGLMVVVFVTREGAGM